MVLIGPCVLEDLQGHADKLVQPYQYVVGAILLVSAVSMLDYLP